MTIQIKQILKSAISKKIVLAFTIFTAMSFTSATNAFTSFDDGDDWTGERIDVVGQRMDLTWSTACEGGFECADYLDSLLQEMLVSELDPNLQFDPTDDTKEEEEKECKSGYTKSELYIAHLAAISFLDNQVAQGRYAILLDAAGLHYAISRMGYPEKTAKFAATLFTVAAGGALQFAAAVTKSNLKDQLSAALADC
jgi:hypothetical protein